MVICFFCLSIWLGNLYIDSRQNLPPSVMPPPGYPHIPQALNTPGTTITGNLRGCVTLLLLYLFKAIPSSAQAFLLLYRHLGHHSRQLRRPCIARDQSTCRTCVLPEAWAQPIGTLFTQHWHLSYLFFQSCFFVLGLLAFSGALYSARF